MRRFNSRLPNRWFWAGCLAILFASPAIGQDLGIGENPFGDLDPGDGVAAPDGPAVEDPMAELQTEEPKTVEDVLKEGSDLYTEGKYLEALNVFNLIIGQNPRIWQAQFEKGRCLAAIGDKQSAIAAYSNAAIYGQGSAEVFFERGNLYYETQQYAEAAKDYGQAAQLNPGDAQALLASGKSMTRQAQQLGILGGASTGALYQSAIDAFDRAISIDENLAEAYFERGITRSGLGETDEAIEDIQTALQKEPTAYGHARLGFVYMSRGGSERRKPRGDRQQALRDFNAAIREFEAFLAEKGDPNTEITSEEKKDPEFIPPQNVLAGVAVARIGLAALSSNMRNAGTYQSVIMDIERAMQFDVSDAEKSNFLLQRGAAERLNGNLETAVRSFTDAIEINPGNYEAVLRRGIVHYHMNSLHLAEADFEQAIEAMQSGRAQFWLGAVHSRRGDFNEAVAYYTQSIRENPGYKPSYNNRGLAYMRLGEFERAAKDFATLVRRDADNSIARSRMEMARQMSDR